MNNLQCKNQQFWINDRPILIQAGEFHYYRTPQEEWRHRLQLLKNAGFNSVANYIPWIWHQLAEGVSDFDGHSHPMRNLEGFLDLAADMGFWIIARPGPYIMAETINEGIPPWVFENYPQAAFISQNNKIQNVASYLHPDFLACVKQWYQAIFRVLTPRQITQGGSIIMIQLDNEMGMIQWVRNIIDINPDTIDRFAEYIRETKGNLIESFPQDNLEEYLTEGIIDAHHESASKIIEEYRRFYRGYLKEYASFLIEESSANGMDVAPVINIHGFANGGKTFPIGLSQLLDVMQLPGVVSATDVYPRLIGEGNFHELYLVNEMTKAIQHEEQALFSIEFQCGGNLDFSNTQTSFYDLHSRLCISSGMRAINHYLFFGGENHPVLSSIKRHDWGPPVRKDGSLRQHYHRYPKLSKALAAYGEDLILSKPEIVTTIGFQLDYFMTEVNTDATLQDAKMITHQRDSILFDFFARGLAISNHPFDAIDLDRQELNVIEHPVLWVMMEKQCHPSTQNKLVDYAKKGGNLVMVGRMCMEDFYHNPCTILHDAIGIQQINTAQPFQRRDINIFNHKDVPVSFIESYEGDFDEVFATDENNTQIGFIKKFEKGKIFMLGASISVVSLVELDILEQLASQVDCPVLLKFTEWVDARLSVGEDGSFLFINNYKDDPVETIVTREDQSLTKGHVIHVPARHGVILPIEWHLSDQVLVHYITSEVRQITMNDVGLVLETAENNCAAEITLKRFSCENATLIAELEGATRVEVVTNTGKIVLDKAS